MYDDNHLLHRLAARGAPDQVFATRPGAPDVTYKALFQGAEGMAAALVAHGLQPGDRIAMQVEKSLEAVQLYLATVMAGGVFLPLNTAYTAAEVAYFLTDATPRIVVCDPTREGEITPLANGATVLTLALDGTGTLTDAAQGQGGFSAYPRTADDLAAILYTSGTTGRSKGAMLSHANLASNSETLREAWGFTHDDVLIHALPIFHTHGLFVATNVALLAGACVHFLPKFDADAIIAAMPTSTALMGVPTFYTRLLDHPGLTRETVSNMRLFVSGSAPLLVDTHEKWAATTGHRILERYGMTETNMNTSNPLNGERRAGTVGFPLPGVELRIVDGERQVPQGDIGVLEVRGPNVFKGYWQMPEKTAEELRPDGWFITGDQGFTDADGYVTIVGRAKDMIISGGFNIYPAEIERELLSHPDVIEAAVIGVPDEDWGEGVKAVVELREGATGDADALIALCKARLGSLRAPKSVDFRDSLPRNATGKVLKREIRAPYWAGRDRAI